ncbi:MAG: isocitrate lyase/phosphoenolpyruvate mutase family protein [Chloroflexi bacterium]|nr:isocitrate lyase/phosphoenolpyruvate mutase family protein [Chloroflexota bacterium]
MVNAEGGFGNAGNVMRTVRELAAVGVSGSEIEDNFGPQKFNVKEPGLLTKEAQVGKLKAAVAARIDPTTVIVARSAAFGLVPLDEALDRLSAYSQTGAEAVMLTGVKSREQIEAAHGATSLPITILNPPIEARNDSAFLAANGVRLLMLGNPTFAVAVKAIYDSYKHLQDGGAMEDLADNQAPRELLQAVNRTNEFIQLQQEYVKD